MKRKFTFTQHFNARYCERILGQEVEEAREALDALHSELEHRLQSGRLGDALSKLAGAECNVIMDGIVWVLKGRTCVTCYPK